MTLSNKFLKFGHRLGFWERQLKIKYHPIYIYIFFSVFQTHIPQCIPNGWTSQFIPFDIQHGFHLRG